MAVFKCKMCGGSLEVTEGMSVCECEYCGTKQTLPKTDNEQALNMFNRANHFRQQCEFDKAAEIYERMTAQRDDAELYWSIVLCRYGIEYVDDPLTKKKIPTCHRTQYKSILEDADYLEALSHADSVQKEVYKQEAEYIDKVQKGILEISNKEKPFDVFICYKETDDMGRRTPDSVLAQDLYYGLVKEGFKVFFSRITLESKLGTEYEPYIFAALNSAKVMVVVGTKPEYFNAVWVRNEWSRYLMLMQEDRSRTLIPAYKDMDPYDLPDALSMFQAQDMTKLGFMQDLIHGIKKIVSTDEPKKEVVKETVVRTSSSNIENLIKRGNLALEDGKWDDARGFFDQVLNEDVEEHRAYIGFLCAEYGIVNEQMLVQVNKDFTQSEYYQKACRFGGDEVKERLYGYMLQGQYDIALDKLNKAKTSYECVIAKQFFESIISFSDAKQKVEDCEEKRRSIIYSGTENIMKTARSESSYLEAARRFESLGEYRDSKQRAANCNNKAKECHIKEQEERNLKSYNSALKALDVDSNKGSRKTIDDLKASIKVFEGLGDFKDSKEQIKNCETKIAEIEEHLQKVKEAEARARKKKKKITIIISAAAVVAVAAVIVFVTVFLPMIKYSNAKKLLDDKKYDEAIEAFDKLNGYKDSNEQVKEATYQKAMQLFDNDEYIDAIEYFEKVKDYKDSEDKITESKDLGKEEAEYRKVVEYLNQNEYSMAIVVLKGMSEYKDSKELLEKAQKDYYDLAEKKAQEKDYAGAVDIYKFLDDYADSNEKKNKLVISNVVQLAKTGHFYEACTASKEGDETFDSILSKNGLSKQLTDFKNDLKQVAGYYESDDGADHYRVYVNESKWDIIFNYEKSYTYWFERQPVITDCDISFIKSNGKYMSLTILLSDGDKLVYKKISDNPAYYSY